jgi:hypothetical protein
MKQPFFCFAMILVLCSHLDSMESTQNNEDDKILYFNIGGYKMDISRPTIEQFGGTYLNALICGTYAITKDRKGRIFIDRPQEEGEIISYFTRCQQIPEKYDHNTIKNMSEFFGIKSFIKYKNEIREKRLKMSEYKALNNVLHKNCHECGENLSGMRGLVLKAHLLSHHAEIKEAKKFYNGNVGKDEEEYLYRVPLPSKKKQKKSSDKSNLSNCAN